MAARVGLEEELHKAVRDEQFVLHYQAQVDHLGCVTGAEVLVRWHHPRRGTVLPGEFIPLPEETGLIVRLGEAVFRMACAQLAAWWKALGREAVRRLFSRVSTVLSALCLAAMAHSLSVVLESRAFPHSSGGKGNAADSVL